MLQMRRSTPPGHQGSTDHPHMPEDHSSTHLFLSGVFLRGAQDASALRSSRKVQRSSHNWSQEAPWAGVETTLNLEPG